MNTLQCVAILFFGVVFAGSLFMLARILMKGRQEQASFDQLTAALAWSKSADGKPLGRPLAALKE